MSSKLSKTISYIVFALIGVALLFFVFKDVDFSAMWNDIVHANYVWIGLALVLAMVAYICRAARWNLLIEATCDHKPSLKNAFWAEMFGYFANLALPRVGEIARCGALKRTENLPFDTLIGTVIVERAFDVLVTLLLAFITFFLQIDLFGAFISDKVLAPTAERFSSISLNGVILVCALLLLTLILFFVLKGKDNFVVTKIKSFCKGIFEGLSSVYKLEKRGWFMFYTIALWACYWIMTWFVCLALQPTANLGLDDGLFLLVVGSIGMAVPVQGGIGAYHYIVALALTIYNLDFNSVGLLYATISHESQLILEILLGIVSLYFVFRKKNV
ncbi:MAG: flippase-like domain-containing protein [Bacteroidales bacterium]|nr:flippase-like domain-containing protein [Bacteroidales bacterium]